jgi:hypothetical protein
MQNRDTTRKEDWAYSLLGIFDLSMSVIYGEGREKAVLRLRKEIKEKEPVDTVKNQDDEDLQDKVEMECLQAAKTCTVDYSNVPQRAVPYFVTRTKIQDELDHWLQEHIPDRSTTGTFPCVMDVESVSIRMDHERSWHISKYSSRVVFHCRCSARSRARRSRCYCSSACSRARRSRCCYSSACLRARCSSWLLPLCSFSALQGFLQTGARNLVFVWTSYEEL